MAVMMIIEWDGVTKNDYDRVNELMGIGGPEDAPDGLISHTAAIMDNGGLAVVDVWESEEALGQFVEARLAPAIQQLGLPEAQPRIHPVHNSMSAAPVG
jgi:hypothetical protein